MPDESGVILSHCCQKRHLGESYDPTVHKFKFTFCITILRCFWCLVRVHHRTAVTMWNRATLNTKRLITVCALLPFHANIPFMFILDVCLFYFILFLSPEHWKRQLCCKMAVPLNIELGWWRTDHCVYELLSVLRSVGLMFWLCVFASQTDFACLPAVLLTFEDCEQLKWRPSFWMSLFSVYTRRLLVTWC